MEQFLVGVFNHGGVFVNLFGWNTGSGDAVANATTGPAALRAYRKFLSGEKLSERGGTGSGN